MTRLSDARSRRIQLGHGVSSHIHCALDQLIGAQVTLDLHFFKLIQSAAKQQAEERGPAAAAALTAPLWRCRQAAGELA